MLGRNILRPRWAGVWKLKPTFIHPSIFSSIFPSSCSFSVHLLNVHRPSLPVHPYDTYDVCILAKLPYFLIGPAFPNTINLISAEYLPLYLPFLRVQLLLFVIADVSPTYIIFTYSCIYIKYWYLFKFKKIYMYNFALILKNKVWNGDFMSSNRYVLLIQVWRCSHILSTDLIRSSTFMNLVFMVFVPSSPSALVVEAFI